MFYKTGTWEDLKMLAAENETMGRAEAGMWKLTEEEMIQARCRAREDWEANHRWMNNTIARQKAELEQKDAEIARQKSEIERYKAEAYQLKDDIGRLKKEMEQIKKIMKELSYGKV